MGRNKNNVKKKKTSRGKKILKITAISLLTIILILALAPMIFKGKIMKVIKSNVNKNITATLDFEDVSLSLLRNFPKASVAISNLSITNMAPFEGDTLFYAEKIRLKMGLGELFRKEGEAMNIKAFSVDNASVNVLVNKDGAANYNIAKESDTPAKEETEETAGDPMTLAVEEYQITNSNIVYFDEGSNMKLAVNDLNHSGSGDLSASVSELNTKTHALVSFAMGGTEYLSKNNVDLDALIKINLEESRYSFLENKALINQLPLVFDGFVKINEGNQEVDITFKTPSSDFKNFLAVIPAAYSKNIENVETSGNFTVDGFFKGIVDDTHIPTFSIKMASENASFKYPDLPKAVSNINLATEVGNPTGLLDDTFINIEKLAFKIDQDVFNASANIKNIVKNPYINARINGRLNLANLSQAYPVQLENELSGILNANLNTAFDMNSIEQKRYGNTKNQGSFVLSDFKFDSEEMNNPVEIAKADLSFNTTTVSLNEFTAKTGQSDFSAKGTIKNLLGFMFNSEKLEGNFNLNSNTFAVNDFMMAGTEETKEETKTEEETTPTPGEPQKVTIPAFLDCTINAVASNVLYDNLNLKNVKGTLKIQDQKATITSLTSEIFGGRLGLAGEVSTKEETPTFAVNLKMDAFDIASSFKELQFLNFLTPLANAVNGKLNSDITLSGNLKDDLTPQLASLSGDVLGELLNASLIKENSPLLQSFDQKLNFIDIKDLDLKTIKTALSFKDGKVNVKPFNLKYKDIDIEVAGDHGIDKSLSYTAKLDVPAKYLGKDASGLLSKLSEKEASETMVPVNVDISGNFTSPSVKTDVKNAVANLTQQLAAKQKDKLVDKGKDALTGLLGKDNKGADSTGTKKGDAVKETAKNVLGGLFGKKKKKKDSTGN